MDGILDSRRAQQRKERGTEGVADGHFEILRHSFYYFVLPPVI